VATTEVTVPGARKGDFALVSTSQNIFNTTMSAHVSALNTVTVAMCNLRGAWIDFAPLTVYVTVIPLEVA
jgi:hypothetical protein